jgi:hypothetical protein
VEDSKSLDRYNVATSVKQARWINGEVHSGTVKMAQKIRGFVQGVVDDSPRAGKPCAIIPESCLLSEGQPRNGHWCLESVADSAKTWVTMGEGSCLRVVPPHP